MQTVQLECGCKRGEERFMCSEAVRLWNETGKAYHLATRTGAWEAYDKVRAEYGDHTREC